MKRQLSFQRFLVPQTPFGNALVPATLLPPTAKQGFEDNRIPKQSLGTRSCDEQ